MQERRRTARYRCKLRCNVFYGKRQDAATVVDVSLSGLCIQTALPLTQGDAVRVEFLEGMRIQIKALAWNVRRMRKAGAVTNVVGMMLSEVGPEYEMLVAKIGGGSAPRSERAASAAASSAGSTPSGVAGRPGTSAGVPGAAKRLTPVRGMPPLPSGRQPWWKLRVKESGGTRTRVLTLAAATAEEAAAKAVHEMGAGWEVVEVRANAG